MYKGLSWWKKWNVPFARDACSGTESVLQQECEEDMFPWPHSDAISRQQAASSAVAELPGSMQAKTGDPPNRVIRRKTPTLVTCFTDLKSTKAVLLDASIDRKFQNCRVLFAFPIEAADFQFSARGTQARVRA